jgi:hypothetical protein
MSWANLESLLKLTGEGLEALDTRQKYGVVISFTNSSMPAAYEASSNTCTLKSSLKAPTLASYFVHEMIHALNQNSGLTSDINALSQSEYVNEMVTEEFIATTRQYQFFVTLDINGQIPGGQMGGTDMPPRYPEYRSAYNTGVRRGRGVTSDASQLHLMGMVNANRLLKLYVFDRGLGVGFMSYKEYYSREWQKNKLQSP